MSVKQSKNETEIAPPRRTPITFPEWNDMNPVESLSPGAHHVSMLRGYRDRLDDIVFVDVKLTRKGDILTGCRSAANKRVTCGLVPMFKFDGVPEPGSYINRARASEVACFVWPGNFLEWHSDLVFRVPITSVFKIDLDRFYEPCVHALSVLVTARVAGTRSDEDWSLVFARWKNFARGNFKEEEVQEEEVVPPKKKKGIDFLEPESEPEPEPEAEAEAAPSLKVHEYKRCARELAAFHIEKYNLIHGRAMESKIRIEKYRKIVSDTKSKIRRQMELLLKAELDEKEVLQSLVMVRKLSQIDTSVEAQDEDDCMIIEADPAPEPEPEERAETPEPAPEPEPEERAETPEPAPEPEAEERAKTPEPAPEAEERAKTPEPAPEPEAEDFELEDPEPTYTPKSPEPRKRPAPSDVLDETVDFEEPEEEIEAPIKKKQKRRARR